MSEYTLDLEGARKLLREVVEEKGENHIAEDCVIYDYLTFQDEGQKTPVCIVGYAIARLVGHEEFQNVGSGFVEIPLASVGIDATPEALQLLSLVQRVQDGAEVDGLEFDGNRPWGLSLAYAEKHYEEYAYFN